MESRRGEEGPELRRRDAPKEELGPGGGVEQIHNPGSRSVAKVESRKRIGAEPEPKRREEGGARSGRRRGAESDSGRRRGRSQSPGDEPGEGTAMESKAVWGQGGRYLDFGGSVGAESDQGAETEPGILNTQLETWRRTRGLGEIEPRREARPGGGLGCRV